MSRDEEPAGCVEHSSHPHLFPILFISDDGEIMNLLQESQIENDCMFNEAVIAEREVRSDSRVL